MGDYNLKSAIAKIQKKRVNFALYKGKEENGLLITNKPPSKKQITELEEECGDTTRQLKGLCFFDGKILVFASETEGNSSMQAMIEKVLKAHQCPKYEIAMRALGPGESDEASVEDDTENVTGTEAESTSTETEETTTEKIDPAVAFKSRLETLMPKIKEAVTAGNQEVKLRASEAALFARKQEYPRANALLDEVEKHLQSDVPPTTQPQTETPVTKTQASGADFAKVRLVWDGTLKKVQGEMQQLKGTILNEFKGVFAYNELAQKVGKLDHVFDGFEELNNLFDAALNSEDPVARADQQKKAAELVKTLRARANDPLLTALASNPFTPLNAQKTVLNTLDALASRLA